MVAVINKGNTLKYKLLCFVMSIVCVLGLMGTNVYANVSEEQAMSNLTTYVYGKLSQTSYTLAEGGSIKGTDLFTGKPTEGYDLDEQAFKGLSREAQSKLVSDIASLSREAVTDDRVDGVTDNTVQTWWKNLQTKDGVGSKFMGEILKNTKPDFVTANKIYEPFSGPVSTAMGIIAVLMMAGLGITMVLDLSYIVIPAFRQLLGGDDKPKWVSADAYQGVKASEGDVGGDGAKKQALSFYLKRRIVALILLGICLLYLVNGQIFTLVGYILDLVSGFLGF